MPRGDMKNYALAQRLFQRGRRGGGPPEDRQQMSSPLYRRGGPPEDQPQPGTVQHVRKFGLGGGGRQISRADLGNPSIGQALSQAISARRSSAPAQPNATISAMPGFQDVNFSNALMSFAPGFNAVQGLAKLAARAVGPYSPVEPIEIGRLSRQQRRALAYGRALANSMNAGTRGWPGKSYWSGPPAPFGTPGYTGPGGDPSSGGGLQGSYDAGFT